jgi:hypothetical protein
LLHYRYTLGHTQSWSGFANAVVNDLSHLLDEGLSHLATIRAEQVAMDAPSWSFTITITITVIITITITSLLPSSPSPSPLPL